MQTKITADDVQDMVRHWLGCPAGGYLGLDYGSDIPSLLHSPMGAGLADGQIAKCRADVPLLGAMPADAINVLAVADERAPADRLRIVFEVAGGIVEASA